MTGLISSPIIRRTFRRKLLRWFDREKRVLPWRGETDPYRILVSEIMLQQTRVAVVEERYKQFLKLFPTAKKLASASEDTVLAAWSGLGYYRRARNLHAAARHVQQNGGFSRTSTKLMELPGIGRYTAAAVASIAFGEPAAVVDGNVRRVLQRLSGQTLSDDACWESAQDLLEERRPGDFNQAMMELGAVVCLPGQPVCNRCPVVGLCASRGATQKKARGQRKKATLSYLLSHKGEQVFLQQRKTNLSLMPGMWELPVIKHPRKAPVLKLRHSITTTDYSILVFIGKPANGTTGRWVKLSDVHQLPLTGLTKKILSQWNAIA
jgi:A/G-specific adenine glycosylase